MFCQEQYVSMFHCQLWEVDSGAKLYEWFLIHSGCYISKVNHNMPKKSRMEKSSRVYHSQKDIKYCVIFQIAHTHPPWPNEGDAGCTTHPAASLLKMTKVCH